MKTKQTKKKIDEFGFITGRASGGPDLKQTKKKMTNWKDRLHYKFQWGIQHYPEKVIEDFIQQELDSQKEISWNEGFEDANNNMRKCILPGLIPKSKLKQWIKENKRGVSQQTLNIVDQPEMALKQLADVAHNNALSDLSAFLDK